MARIDIRDLMISFLSRRQPIPWLDWLPLAEIAVDTPEQLAPTLNTIELDKQFDLVNLLRMPDAGPLAHTIIITLAQYAGEIEDVQVRQYILMDTVDSWDCTASTLNKIHERLSERVIAKRKCLQKGFELAREITCLERELADIRAKEHDQDERFARVHQLELEIQRLETRRRILTSYNETERRHYLETLQAEIIPLQQRKTELEQAIADAMSNMRTMERTLQEKRNELQEAAQLRADLERQVQEKENELEQRKRELEQRMRELKTARCHHEDVQKRLQELQSQVERLEKEKQEKEALLKKEQQKLEELQKAAQRSGRAELERKIQEVYALLPEDLVDRAVPTSRS
jgi:DNA repair exonuclease SbcCD ATPase subunit